MFITETCKIGTAWAYITFHVIVRHFPWETEGARPGRGSDAKTTQRHCCFSFMLLNLVSCASWNLDTKAVLCAILIDERQAYPRLVQCGILSRHDRGINLHKILIRAKSRKVLSLASQTPCASGLVVFAYHHCLLTGETYCTGPKYSSTSLLATGFTYRGPGETAAILNLDRHYCRSCTAADAYMLICQKDGLEIRPSLGLKACSNRCATLVLASSYTKLETICTTYFLSDKLTEWKLSSV